MKTELEIVTVDCSGKIPVENGISLDEIDLPSEDHHKVGKDLAFDNGNMVLYDSGKFIIHANSEEGLEELKDEFIQKLREIGMDYEKEDFNFEISNMVASGKLNRTIDLNKLSLAIGYENTDYEGDQFSGLIITKYPINVTVYSNGKVNLSGAKNRELIKKVFYEMLVEDIKKFSQRMGI